MLIAKQIRFSQLLARFIYELQSKGYGITLGEAYRTAEMAEIYAKQGKGIVCSNHCLRLAIDLNLFKGSALMQSVKDYEEAGVLWESYGTEDFLTRWGGRFERPDADHFSILYQGAE